MLFNHSAVRISLDRMDDALALFSEVLGFEEVFEMSGAEGGPASPGPFRMSVLRQPTTNVDVQLTAVDAGDSQDAKLLNQIGFVSDDATTELETVRQWCEARGLDVATGHYGPGFFWIDVPEVFMDFVLEVMDRQSLLATGYTEPVI